MPVFTITPQAISVANKNCLLIHFHGGGYVLSLGDATKRYTNDHVLKTSLLLPIYSDVMGFPSTYP